MSIFFKTRAFIAWLMVKIPKMNWMLPQRLSWVRCSPRIHAWIFGTLFVGASLSRLGGVPSVALATPVTFPLLPGGVVTVVLGRLLSRRPWNHSLTSTWQCSLCHLCCMVETKEAQLFIPTSIFIWAWCLASDFYHGLSIPVYFDSYLN